VETWTGVVPTGKNEPLAGVAVTGVVPLTASLPVNGPKLTTAPAGSDVVTVQVCSPLMIGGVVSTTLMLNVPLVEALRLSVAVAWTVVLPRGNVEPEAGVEVSDVIVRPESAVAI